MCNYFELETAVQEMSFKDVSIFNSDDPFVQPCVFSFPFFNSVVFYV